MNDGGRPEAIVLLADVVGSRRDFASSSSGLAQLVQELDAQYGDARLAAFDYTQGDELQGLLTPSADPLAAVLIPALAKRPLRLRWAVARGRVEPGDGPATRRTGRAFIDARDALGTATRRRLGLVMRTGEAEADGLLADLAPLLPVLLEDLSARQREIARLILLERLRQTDVADRLDVSRATVSVASSRGRVDGIAGLVRALRTLFGVPTA